MRNDTYAPLMIALLICVLLGAPGQAEAKTWHVEKDGSGDYTIIQEAVDAAASGDTIRIGPGRYNDRRLYTYPGWSDSVIVTVFQYELTLIGSGPATILGQNFPWTLEQGWPKAINTGHIAGNHMLHVSRLRIENMAQGIYMSYEQTAKNNATISDCEFYNCHTAIWAQGNAGQLDIARCSFAYQPRDGTFISAWDHRNLTITDCSFLLLEFFPWGQGSINLTSVEYANIRNCDFTNGRYAIVVAYCEQTDISDCRFYNQDNVAFGPGIASRITLENSQFFNVGTVASTGSGDNHISMRQSIINDVKSRSFHVMYVGSLDVQDCNLDHGSEGAVVVADTYGCTTPTHLDFRNNYWGTDNPDSIQAWIRDYNDSDQACYIIDYEPFRGVSTPTEKTSLGGVKAMFR